MHFQYEALDKKGNLNKGHIVSSTRQEAIQSLKQQGLNILKLEEAKPSKWKKYMNIWIGKPVKPQEFVLFCRQLAVLLQSGTTITETLRILVEQAESKPFQKALQHIYADLRSGNSFSEACQKHPTIFQKLFVNMIRAGEMGGNLDESMEKIADFYERDHRTKEKVKSALAYPSVVVTISLIVVLFLLVRVIPQLVNSLVASGADIPLPTAIVLAISQMLTSYWYIFTIGLLGCVLLFWMMKSHPTFQYYLDMAKLKIPVFGPLLQKTAIARMSRTMSSLFSSSVPILQSLTMVADIVHNEVIARVLLEAKESVGRGNSIAGPLQKSEFFPSLVTHMIQVGEETGQLEDMLEKISYFYEEDVEQMTNRLSSILEPLMIVVLAVIVGTIVLAALLPMFQIYQQV